MNRKCTMVIAIASGLGCHAPSSTSTAPAPEVPSAIPAPTSISSSAGEQVQVRAGTRVRSEFPATAYAKKDCTQPLEAMASTSGDACSDAKTCAQPTDCVQGEHCDCGCCLPDDPSKASQQSPVSPSGHEFLTLEGAVRAQLIAFDFPGQEYERGIERDGLCSGPCQHHAQSFRVWSTIMGVRWADIMGFRAGPFFPTQQRCLLAVAQDNDDVQYDHALRRKTEAGPEGGVAAMDGIRRRLTDRFVTAARADDDIIDLADGGAQQDHRRAARAYFLFGRALHIVQDSFSPYHGGRTGEDFASWTQVNSYVCTPNAPAHPHVTPGVKDLLFHVHDYSNGDIIWAKKCEEEVSSCLKPVYDAASNASRDLWLAFWRAHSAPPVDRERIARREVASFIARWMTGPSTVGDGPASTDCPTTEFDNLVERRATCLGVTGGADAGEPPFAWSRKHFPNIK